MYRKVRSSGYLERRAKTKDFQRIVNRVLFILNRVRRSALTLLDSAGSRSKFTSEKIGRAWRTIGVQDF